VDGRAGKDCCSIGIRNSLTGENRQDSARAVVAARRKTPLRLARNRPAAYPGKVRARLRHCPNKIGRAYRAGKTLWAKFVGYEKPDEVVILGRTPGFVGAGTGSARQRLQTPALVIEAARAIKATGLFLPRRTIRFVLF